MAKESAYSAGCSRHGFDPWVGKIPWRREWQPIPVFLPGESLGKRILVGYSPCACKESDTTEVTEHTHPECVPKLPRYQDLVAPPGHL